MTNISFSQELAFSIYSSKEDYPVDLDDAWQWLGYDQKSNCLNKLKNNFEDGEDFSSQSVKSPTGGRPRSAIYLTVECFKSLGMMAGTSQGKAIRKYFIECEKIAKTKSQEPQKLAIHHYGDRVMALESHLKFVPEDHWVIMQHCNQVLLKIERMGYPVSAFDLADASIGRRWADYRRTLGLSDNIVKKAKYTGVNQANFPISPKAYHLDELATFVKWLNAVYMQVHLPRYLEEKYGGKLIK